LPRQWFRKRARTEIDPRIGSDILEYAFGTGVDRRSIGKTVWLSGPLCRT